MNKLISRGCSFLFVALALVLASCEDDETATPKVSFETETVQIAENATAALQLKVMLSDAAPSDLIIPFTLSGTAVEGVNFEAIADKSVVINKGEKEGVIFITPLNVSVIEESKTVIITLGMGKSFELGQEKIACTVTISDNTTPPADAKEVSFVGTSVYSNAYLTETVEVEVAVAEAATKDLKIAVTFEGTAEDGTNYTVDGLNANSEITILQGETSAKFTVSVKYTSEVNINKTVIAKFGQALNTDYSTSPTNNAFTINIIDPTIDFSGSWMSEANKYLFFYLDENKTQGGVDGVYQVKQQYNKGDGTFANRSIYPYVKLNSNDPNMWATYKHTYYRAWETTNEAKRWENSVGNLFGILQMFSATSYFASYTQNGAVSDGFLRFVLENPTATTGKVIVPEQTITMYKPKSNIDWNAATTEKTKFWYGDSELTLGDLSKSNNVDPITLTISGAGTFDLSTNDVTVNVTVKCSDADFVTKNGGESVTTEFKFIPNK